MPVTLSELQNMGNSRPVTPPPMSKAGPKVTLIDDVFKKEAALIQQQGKQKFYHDINPNDPRAVFMKKMDYPGSNYNSDWTIPVMADEFPSPPAQRFIDAASKAFPDNSVVYDMQGNPIDIPRRSSPLETVIANDQQIRQYTAFNTSPPIAGGVPMMKDASKYDLAIPMGVPLGPTEPFRFQSGEECKSCLNHTFNCPECRKFFSCNNKPYIVSLMIFITLFLVVLFYLLKRPNYYY